MRLSSLLMLLVAAATLGGCATSKSKFSCPGPQGVRCMSAPDIYEATNHADEVVAVDARDARAGIQPGKAAPSVPAAGAVEIRPEPAPMPAVPGRPWIGAEVDGDTLIITGAGERAAAPPQRSRPIPPRSSFQPVDGEALREPARIMRIYVRPWEDEKGDLHMGGYVYTEIEPRKWAVARRAQADHGAFRLLGTTSPTPDAAPPQSPGGEGRRMEDAASSVRDSSSSVAPPNTERGF